MSRRTRIVWAAFAASMTLATGLLVLGDEGAPRALLAAGQGRLDDTVGRSDGRGALASLLGIGRTSRQGTMDGSDASIRPREVPLDSSRWKAIVVHHSGSPAGDVESIERQHLSFGYASLGYHFVIGNGHGLGDGAVFVGPRWNRQQAGAHVAGRRSEWMNQHAIAICLVGNGDRRPFTERQLRELVGLVRRLQETLEIPGSAVHLHSDLAQVTSPGRLFPAAAFESQLRR